MTLQKLLFVTLVASSASLVACSTPTEVTTRDGRVITTPDSPDVDDDGFVTYEKNDAEVRLNRDDVHSMEEIN